MLEREPFIRLAAFAAILCLMAAWEWLAPRRPRALTRRRRWPANLAIVLLNTLVLRAVIPAGAVGFALLAQTRGWGLLNQYAVPSWLSVAGGALLLDLAVYLQHVLFHAVPALWRLHRMHHADLDIDFTTGARFHPLEIALSMLVKLAVIGALGISATAVLVFEVLLNATSMFNHANVRLPLRLDAVLRWLVVTPDMHRVHHSVERDETNSNLGFNLSVWDRTVGTYRSQPRAGHVSMTVGAPDLRDERECARLQSMLLMPFRQARRRSH